MHNYTSHTVLLQQLFPKLRIMHQERSSMVSQLPGNPPCQKRLVTIIIEKEHTILIGFHTFFATCLPFYHTCYVYLCLLCHGHSKWCRSRFAALRWGYRLWGGSHPHFVCWYKISFHIPSFPAFTVKLRHVKYQFSDKNGMIQLYDGFIRDCPVLDTICTPYRVTGKGMWKHLFYWDKFEYYNYYYTNNYI